MKGVSRGAMPWLLAAEGAQLVAELAAAKMNPHNPERAEQLGRRVGLLASVGAGAITGAMGGPVGFALGAAAGAGTWVAGEQAGQRAAEWVKGTLGRRSEPHFRQPD